MEWNRVDLQRGTAWLNQTKNGTPRGVPLNRDAIAVLEEQHGKYPQFCFTYRGEPTRWDVTNTAWQTATQKAEIEDFASTISGTLGPRGIVRLALAAMS